MAITLREIAEKAGVSRMTVSLALRDDERILPATRAKVKRAANELGYRPDPQLAKLMAHLREARKPRYQSTLAFINAWSDARKFTQDPRLSRVWSGAKERALALGYHLECFWLCSPGMTTRRMVRMLGARGIKGVILPPFPHGEHHVSTEWLAFSVVAATTSIWTPSLHRVCPYHYDSMMKVLTELDRRGFRRIGLVLGSEHDERTGFALSAAFRWFQAARRQAVERVEPLVMTQSDQGGFLGWLQAARPEAIICDEPEPYRSWADKAGQKVPRNLSLAVLGLTEPRGSVSGIYQNHERIGAAAVDLLTSLIHRDEKGTPTNPKIVMIEGAWNAGESVRAKP